MHKPTSSLSFLATDVLNKDQKTLDRRYQDSENSFKSIFERSPTGNLILSKDLVVLQANDALVKMLGLTSVDDIVQRNILQFVNAAYRTDWLLLQQSLWVQKAPSFTIETCLIKNNDETIWCKLTSIVYQESGSTLGYAIIEDISKRKNDEEIVKRSQANLLSILDNADSGYVLYNSRLQIVTFNNLAQKFAAILYDKQLEVGNYLLDYFPIDRHDVLLSVTRRVMQGEDICYERGFKNAKDEDRWMEAKWLNVKDRDNKSWGFILASKDITETKLAAIELEKINSELTQRNKSLEQFANITSHNLRAPVANIIGLVELVEEMEMEEDEKKEMMDGILLSARNLNTVIDDINDILQLKEHFNQTRERINLEHIVHDIKLSISGMIQKANVVINCDFAEVESMISIRSYLYSVFYNMILNSIKYRRLDIDPVIDLTAKSCNDKIRLSFKDNGKGIDMKRNGDSLFGLYKRFDSSVQGKGLGLFMVKSQIESLNGTIDVISELGKGTEFIVEFPVQVV